MSCVNPFKEKARNKRDIMQRLAMDFFITLDFSDYLFMKQIWSIKIVKRDGKWVKRTKSIVKGNCQIIF